MIVDGLHQCSVYKLYYYFLNNYNNITKVMINNEFTLNKEERYNRVPRLSDTRYSAKGTKRKWRYASSKAILK